jgi:hypothetical protein
VSFSLILLKNALARFFFFFWEGVPFEDPESLRAVSFVSDAGSAVAAEAVP